ncbi:hypothetical protein V6Z12_D11G140800 [Gossypium hirsutum]
MGGTQEPSAHLWYQRFCSLCGETPIDIKLTKKASERRDGNLFGFAIHGDGNIETLSPTRLQLVVKEGMQKGN